MILHSVVRMQRSLDSRNADDGIKDLLEDLSTNISSELSSQISPILQSMSSEFEGFK